MRYHLTEERRIQEKREYYRSIISKHTPIFFESKCKKCEDIIKREPGYFVCHGGTIDLPMYDFYCKKCFPTVDSLIDFLIKE